MVKDLAKKAELKTPPKVKTSSSLPDYAKASFVSKHIIVDFKLISKWEKGEIDDDYVESVLAHETGHIMDLSARENQRVIDPTRAIDKTKRIYEIYPIIK